MRSKIETIHIRRESKLHVDTCVLTTPSRTLQNARDQAVIELVRALESLTKQFKMPTGSDAKQIKACGSMGHALRDGVAFSFGAQWTWRIGKKIAGRQLDSIERNAFPETSSGDQP
jgi:hypothetical protein